MKTSKQVLIILITIAVTIFAVLVILNLGLGEKKIEKRIETLYTVEDPQFLRTMGVMLGPPVIPGNAGLTLLNGDQIFPAMLKAIKEARKTISFETYIYWEGDIGKQFADALAERAHAGVKIHVLLDWVGSGKIADNYLQEMQAAGIEVRRYNRPGRGTSSACLNNRDHRKILVVDGKIGFTGGVGIADKWSGHAQDEDHWRDTHFRLEGPAVAQMQAAFHDNWVEVTGVVLHGEAVPSSDWTGWSSQCASVREFARRRRREHAAHVHAVDRRVGKNHSFVGRLFRYPTNLRSQPSRRRWRAA